MAGSFDYCGKSAAFAQDDGGLCGIVARGDACVQKRTGEFGIEHVFGLLGNFPRLFEGINW